MIFNINAALLDALVLAIVKKEDTLNRPPKVRPKI